MSKIYITQVPQRRDPATGAFVPMDIKQAYAHGEVVIMMPPRAAFYATADLVRQLRAHLKDYSFEAGDCLVALGDPAVIAVACALLGKMHGKFSVLKWDRETQRYYPSQIVV